MIYLINEDTVRSLSNISDNVQGKFLLPAIREAQEINLQGILGTSLYNKLQSLIDDDTIADEENSVYRNMLDTYIKYFLVYQTVANLTVITSYKIANASVAASTDENLQTLSLKEVFQLQDYYNDKADFYCKRLQGYLRENSARLPELHKDNMYQMDSNTYSSANCSIFLGGARGKGKKGCKKI